MVHRHLMCSMAHPGGGLTFRFATHRATSSEETGFDVRFYHVRVTLAILPCEPFWTSCCRGEKNQDAANESRPKGAACPGGRNGSKSREFSEAGAPLANGWCRQQGGLGPSRTQKGQASAADY